MSDFEKDFIGLQNALDEQLQADVLPEPSCRKPKHVTKLFTTMQKPKFPLQGQRIQ